MLLNFTFKGNVFYVVSIEITLKYFFWYFGLNEGENNSLTWTYKCFQKSFGLLLELNSTHSYSLQLPLPSLWKRVSGTICWTSPIVFHRRKKVISVWNDLSISNFVKFISCLRISPALLSRKYASRQRITAWWQMTRTFSCRSSSMINGSTRWTKSWYDWRNTRI